jgi:predicted Zn-dependent protease
MSVRLSLLALGLSLSTGIGNSVAAAHDGTGLCQSVAPESVVAAKAALAATPESLAARIKLADALIEANCYDDAVHTLEAGEAIHPRNSELTAKLRTTRSLVSEQHYFEGMEQAEVAARVSRNLLRCSKLGDINACDDALKLKPNDPDILLAKGDALLQASKPADAELIYRKAKQVAPDNPKITAQLAAAQAQRQAFLSSCQKSDGDTALQACQAALQRGADDEFAVHSRMAQLYQQRNQPAPALASYIAADALKRGDRSVALGIVALTDANPRKDAVALAARGSALLTLKRGTEALASLRQAQGLAPAMPDLRAHIANAQALANAEAKQRVAAPATGSLTSVQVAQANELTAAARARTYSNAAEASRSN